MESKNTKDTDNNSSTNSNLLDEDLQVFANLILDKILEDQLLNKGLFAKK